MHQRNGTGILKQELLQSQKSRDELMKWKLLLVAAIGSVGLGFSSKANPPYAELVLAIIPFVCCYVDLLCRNLSVRTKMLSRFLAAELVSNPQNFTSRFEGFYQRFDAKRNGTEERPLKRDTLEAAAFTQSTNIQASTVTFRHIRRKRFNFQRQLNQLASNKGDALEGLALVKSTRLLSLTVIAFGFFNFLIKIEVLKEFPSISWEKFQLISWESLLFFSLFLLSGIVGWCSSILVEREYNFQRMLIEETGNDWERENKYIEGVKDDK